MQRKNQIVEEGSKYDGFLKRTPQNEDSSSQPRGIMNSQRYFFAAALLLLFGSPLRAVEPVGKAKHVLGVAGKVIEFKDRDTGVLVTAIKSESAATRLSKDPNDFDSETFRLVPGEDVIVRLGVKEIKNFFQLREFIDSIKKSNVFPIHIRSATDGTAEQIFYVQLTPKK